MSNSFGGTIKLKGESEYRKALSDIGKDLRLMSSEMKVLATSTDDSGKASADAKSKKEALAKAIADQRSKLADLNKELASSVDKNGETSDATKKLQTRVNYATADLNKMESQLDGTGGELDNATKKTSIFGDVLKANLASEIIIGGAKKLVGAIGTITDAFKDLVLNAGFDRAMNLEQAEFKLKGLGHSAEATTQIMENALASVKGTAFGLDSASTVASNAVASGVAIGEDLESMLKAVADASAISGRSMEDMGSIFNKVATSGKLTGQELNQLHDSGIPAVQLLSDTMGKSTDEIKKMVSAGEIGMPQLQKAIEQGMGGSALTMGQTFSGARDNLLAGFSRLGAEIMTPFTQALTPALGVATSIIDDIASGSTENIAEKTQQLGDMLGEAVNGLIQGLAPLIKNLLNVASKLIPELVNTIVGMLPTLIPVALDVIMTLVNVILENIPLILQAGIDILLGLVTGITDALPTLIPAIVEAITTIITVLVENLPVLIEGGITLLVALIDGLAKALPTLIRFIPEIISTIITILTRPDMIRMLLRSAFEIIKSLAVGLIQSIPEIVKAIPQVISAMIGGIKDLLVNFKNIGGDMLSGLVDGFKGGISRAKNAIIDSAKQILGKLASFLGINSPSRYMRDHFGKHMASGIGVGFDDEVDEVGKSMERSLKDALPTSVDTDVQLNTGDLATSVSASSSLRDTLNGDNLIGAIQQAFKGVKIELDDKEVGDFVITRVERAVF